MEVGWGGGGVVCIGLIVNRCFKCFFQDGS